MQVMTRLSMLGKSSSACHRLPSSTLASLSSEAFCRRAGTVEPLRHKTRTAVCASSLANVRSLQTALRKNSSGTTTAGRTCRAGTAGRWRTGWQPC
eukprot:7365420-Prymnesium_polylepis.1